MAFTMSVKSVGDYTWGFSVDHTPATAVTGGQVVSLNDEMIGVASSDIAANAVGSIQIVGCKQFPMAAVTITAGEPAYMDFDGNPVNGTASTGAVTDIRTGNCRIGHFVKSHAATESFAMVFFYPCEENENGS
jgi:predicted RecA/RadA family phage recombinase